MEERIDKIRREYMIDSQDLDEIKAELKRRLAKEHPDNNGGVCNMETIQKINDDSEYVESLLKNKNTNAAIVPVDELLRAVIDITKNTQLSKPKEEELQDKLVASIDTQMVDFRKRFTRPRYSLVTVTAILTFLWVMPEKIASHPVVQFFVDAWVYDDFVVLLTFLWVFACVITGIYWTMTAQAERIEKNLLERIKLENFQNVIFMRYIKKFKKGATFSKTDFMDYLVNSIYSTTEKRMYLTRIRKGYVREEVVQSMADIILNRAIEHGVIRKTDSFSLVDCFIVEKKNA